MAMALKSRVNIALGNLWVLTRQRRHLRLISALGRYGGNLESVSSVVVDLHTHIKEIVIPGQAAITQHQHRKDDAEFHENSVFRRRREPVSGSFYSQHFLRVARSLSQTNI